jgi:hypothetical protein
MYQNTVVPHILFDTNTLQIIRTRFLSTEEKLTCRLYISTESLGLHQQTEQLACWLAEAAVDDSSQFTVTCCEFSSELSRTQMATQCRSLC